MQRWKQYGGLAGLLAVCLAAGLYGFTATGGALPYAKRFATALQQGAREGSGPLVDLGRGIVIAGPIRKGGLVMEYAALVMLFAGVGIGLYVYATRRTDENDQDTDRDIL
ncbi:hypothetical protein [Halococcus agarilyticus]|uniref:hypothetical protein n=1 Tax=Halococcus agarilyticus TaxID=1232219 RepID=UPI000677B1E5|nr:hypothetical protein [Halococcus agarilyticus]